jgi:predicted signal transduction protein with EAL and GGDEF domain
MVRHRLVRLLGLAQVTRRVALLFGGVVLAGALATVLVAVLGPAAPAGTVGWGQVTGALGAVVLAQLARVRVRIGTTSVSLGWGEAALIIAIYLLPSAWVPSAVLLGVLLAQLFMRVVGEPRTPVIIAVNAALLALAAAGASALVAALFPAVRDIRDLHLAGVLIVAALSYTTINLALFATAVSVQSGVPVPLVIRQLLAGRLFMVIGNIAVGLLVVVTSAENPRWLLILPPVLWLLRQSYVNRLRADDERAGWQAFSRATEALNQLEERGVVEAGIHGALRLFPSATVEIRILRPDGPMWSYRGGVDGLVASGPATDMPAAPLAVERPLAVGKTPVGELRLCLPTPVTPTVREQMQLSAFADALAAALHDAAAHRELQVLSERSSHAAAHDPLTGIANRDTLLARGNAALRTRDRDAPVALLLLDIDHFKEVNDTLGHAAGDELLRILGARIAGYVRGAELAARLSGDEFGLLLTELPGPADGAGIDGVARDGDEARTGLSGTPYVAFVEDDETTGRVALRRARELADLIAMPTEVAGVQLAVEASVGVVVAAAGSVDMTELLRRADIAMYRAKRGGGAIGRYEEGADDGGSTDRLALLAELREALNCTNQLVLAFQPAIDLRTGAPTGVEALIRWQHPRRGELLPGEFIDVLENSDLVGPFTRYVINQALSVAAKWVDVPISVNVSPRSLLDVELPGQIARLLNRYGVPADRLVLEITETVMIPEHEAVDLVLGQLRELGVQLSLDDFGTGYSSLKFLTQVRVDEVKVDRSFVARMVESAEAMAIIRTTVELTRELGRRVVAEGVETAEQRDALAELGCTAAQGYHFYAPMTPEKVTSVLEALTRSTGGRVIPLRSEDTA